MFHCQTHELPLIATPTHYCDDQTEKCYNIVVDNNHNNVRCNKKVRYKCAMGMCTNWLCSTCYKKLNQLNGDHLLAPSNPNISNGNIPNCQSDCGDNVGPVSRQKNQKIWLFSKMPFLSLPTMIHPTFHTSSTSSVTPIVHCIFPIRCRTDDPYHVQTAPLQRVGCRNDSA